MKFSAKGFKTVASVLAMGMVTATSAFADDKEEDKKDTPMEKEMKIVGKKLKSLRTMPKGDFAAGAKAVREAHAALLRSMAYVPSLIKEMKDGEKKVLALADARRLLGINYALLCELEIAYIKKDTKKIGELMKKLKAVKKEGHKKYDDD